MNTREKYDSVILRHIAEEEYSELCTKVKGMTYEEAFKTLDSSNLTADPIVIGKTNELIGINEFFDVTYKHIRTSIFRTSDNKCEVWEEFDLHVHYSDIIQ